MSTAPVELYPAAELLEQRYVGLMEGGEAALMSAEWTDAREGMVHPTAEVLEEETGSTRVYQEQGEEGRGQRWPELASEVLHAVRTFEAEHDARTLRMYMADWADHLIGKVLGVDEVPWFLLGNPTHTRAHTHTPRVVCGRGHTATQRHVYAMQYILTSSRCAPGLACPVHLCSSV
jgi:hypothetical protein